MNHYKRFLLFSLLGLSFLRPPLAFAQGAPRCSEVYEVLESGFRLPDHPMSPAIEQLIVKRDSVFEFLDIFTGQTQRQVKKLGREIDKFVEGFIRDGELSESAIQKLIQANERLDTFVARIEERAPMLNMDPLRLRRLLFVREPIDPNFVYYAVDLPGFGRTQFHFAKEVADFLNQTGIHRDFFFPTIFRGLVGSKGQDGFKHITSVPIRPPDAREWGLFELKRIGQFQARILAMHTEGHLFLFKVFENHNRVEYMNKENLPHLFFRSKLYEEADFSQSTGSL